ncbi:MAG: Maf family nucleotide pyrophosphatase [Gammaproteobacteria bacterium]|nr:Maf family nucleotide pyrophosphatase [Gammaproteobacteria bacterium]MDH5215742.1 Maf family nucleotide pyrophosphatase [Gammaproteobacteria bacterium]
MSKLHLASSSPRRREILDSLGLVYSWAATDIDESPLAGELAEAMVLRLAAAKARAAGVRDVTAILGADTAVVCGDRVLGKPASVDEAMEMLRNLSGQVHRVLTGVAVLAAGDTQTALSDTRVRFREIGQREIVAYCRSGEFEGKAGAYAIQGLAGMFVESLHGSYSGVVGLPVFETAALLRAAGLDIFSMTTFSGSAK